MGISLGELLGANVKEKLEALEEQQPLHRTKTVKERPEMEIDLQSVSKESREVSKTQKDPTDDLVEITSGLEDVTEIAGYKSGYLIWCNDTKQTWYAHDQLCLNKNFIYRDDLEIIEITEEVNIAEWYLKRGGNCKRGIITSKVCRILDNPANETYEVYYDSNYPTVKYGKATPRGCFILKFENRFHRDMKILELDNLYTYSSFKKAGKFTAKQLGKNEAIIISDGAWMKESCSSSFVYLDNLSVIRQTEGFLPTEETQAVLIAEIKGAYNALMMCKARGKKQITYYYDNTSILNVFLNRKTEYIEEVKEYKQLLEELHTSGFKINFVEIHPKTGEDRDEENKALMLFHNMCDDDCKMMASLYSKDYKSYATQGNKDGKTFSTVKEEMDAKNRKRGQGQNRNTKSYGSNRH